MSSGRRGGKPAGYVRSDYDGTVGELVDIIE
jgi:hypothetical protein